MSTSTSPVPSPLDAIRFGCEFESILRVPTFSMIVPEGMDLKVAMAQYQSVNFKPEIDESQRIAQTKITDSDTRKAVNDANFAMKELSLEGPSPRKYYTLVQRQKAAFVALQRNIDKLTAPGIIKTETQQKDLKAAQEELEKVKGVIRQIPIPGHDNSQFAALIAPHIKAIEAFRELEAKLSHNRTDDWTEPELKEHDAAGKASEESKDRIAYLVKWESRVISAWMNFLWTKLPKFVEIGMINELDGMSSRKGFGTWSITEDPAIDVETKLRSDCFPFEFVGPITQISKSDKSSQRKVMAMMTDFFTFLTKPKTEGGCGCELIRSTISTSTHIHFAPNNTEWSIEQAQRLMCSAYFWDPCVRYLIPYWRRLRQFCPDMRADPGCAPLFPYPEEAFQSVEFAFGRYPVSSWEDQRHPSRFLKCTRKDVLGNLQHILSKSTKSALKELLGPTKNVGWNVRNLKESAADHDAKDTIEWRRGPASLTWEGAMCWIELIFAFALAACDKGTVEQLMEIKNPDMAAFRKWLQPYRFDPSLQIGAWLDEKFDQALDGKNSTGDLAHPLYICLTEKDEAELEAARKAFKLPKVVPRVQGPLPSTPEEIARCEPRHMTAVANMDLNYRETRRMVDYPQIIAQIREQILTSMTLNMTLL